MSQALTRSGKFGSTDDADSTSNSSGHPTCITPCSQQRHVGVACWTDKPYSGWETRSHQVDLLKGWPCSACWIGTKPPTKKTHSRSWLRWRSHIEFSWQRLKGVGETLPSATLPSASISSAGLPRPLSSWAPFPCDEVAIDPGRQNFRYQRYADDRWRNQEGHLLFEAVTVLLPKKRWDVLWGRQTMDGSEALTRRRIQENHYQRHAQSSRGAKVESHRHQVHRSEHLTNWRYMSFSWRTHPRDHCFLLLGVTSRSPADSLL